MSDEKHLGALPDGVELHVFPSPDGDRRFVSLKDYDQLRAQMSDQTVALQQLGDEKFNVAAILQFIDAEAARAYGGSERTQIALVARLIRAQQREIKRPSSVSLSTLTYEDWFFLRDALLDHDGREPPERLLSKLDAYCADTYEPTDGCSHEKL